MLATRLPVLEWHELRLQSPPGRYPLLLPGRRPRVMLLPDEPRAAVAAVLAEPRITVAATHLSFVPGANAVQLRRVIRWLAGLPGPYLLLGDLNLPPGPVRRLTRWVPLAAGRTYPSPAPRVQLDHVLSSGLPAGTTARGQVVRMPISDHRAITVDLELPPCDQRA
jgi:endonuclease/exonuclease/phosphatase family metal-dependent hydrolase